ncbi:hypothetical protein GCM10010309_44360 [Streptomyces violaceochromogenes]|nr:hypothetical protein GCM10010309_44360 [Streptomyces violaceochromogenes]
MAFLGATATFLGAGAFFTAAPFAAFLAADVFEEDAFEAVDFEPLAFEPLALEAAFFADAAPFADAAFFTGSVLFCFAVFLPPSGLCSPTAESRRTTTRAAPSACALTGDLDTRPA